MGQVTIYLDDALEMKMRAAANAMQQSKSSWIANLIRDNIANEWPQTVMDLAGAWKDLPTAEETRPLMHKDVSTQEM